MAERRRGVLAGCVPAILVTLGLIVAATVFISSQWSANVSACRDGWTYPNGTLVEDDPPGFLQISGVLRRVIETRDPQPQVIVWYSDLRDQRRAEALSEGRPESSVVYPGAFRYEPLPDGGTRILLICP